MMFCTNCGGSLENKNSENDTSNNHRKSKLKISKIIVILVAVLGVSYFVYDKIKEKIEFDKEQIEANKLVAFATYKEIGEFGSYGVEGLALVRKEQKDESGKNQTLYGFINERYEECIRCIYQRIEPFEGDVTIVELEDKYALMNKKGEIEQLKYNRIYDFSEEGYARAYTKEYCWIVNRKGKELTKAYGDIDSRWIEGYFNCPVLRIMNEGKYGYMDKNLNEIVECKYDKLPNDYNGYDWSNWKGDEKVAKVNRNGKYGYLDKNFNEVIECKYDDVHVLLSSKEKVRISVRTNGMECLINEYGNEISSWYDDIAYSIKDSRCRVKRNDKYGFIDEDGNLIVSCIYDYANEEFSYGKCSVKYDNRWFVIDKWGNYIR